MENYALIARQKKQIEALKTENDYLKKGKNPTEIENANLRQRNDALELENQSLQSEIQVMTEKYNLLAELEDLEIAEYALVSRQEKQIKALKTENDYLKKGKNPTEIENANLRQRSDALELENQSLQSEIQVMTEEHNLLVKELGAAKQDAESPKARKLPWYQQDILSPANEKGRTLSLLKFIETFLPWIIALTVFIILILMSGAK